MTHTRQSGSPPDHNTDLAIRTRDLMAQNPTITPVTGEFISIQADRCPFPSCTNTRPHQHSTAEGIIAPSIDDFRKAGEAIRERWTEEQRHLIAENETTLQQLTELEPKVRDLSLQPHLPRSNDLTAQDQIAVIHGGATAAQYEATREMLLERHRQDLIANTSPISPTSSAHPGASHNEPTAQTQAERAKSSEWDDFPDLNAQYQNIDFLHTNTRLCTGPCPVQTPHNRGAYLQRGQVPRVWNARWGYSDPPRGIWEAWVRIEQGRGRSWDKVEVDGFALSHWWAGP